jgi:hypothetical protein
MSSDQTGRTVISYSRKEGAKFAARLREWLGERNLAVWQDLLQFVPAHPVETSLTSVPNVPVLPISWPSLENWNARLLAVR